MDNQRETVRILFLNFWNRFNKTKNIFIYALQKSFDVVLCNEQTKASNIDLIIYSCFGSDILLKTKYKDVKKVYYSGENDYPNFNICDYAICMVNDMQSDRMMYMSNYMLDYYDSSVYKESDDELYDDRKFCSFVVSNSRLADPMRDNLYHKLSECIGKIDSGGSYLNNMGHRVDDKIEFCSQYRFNLACENSDGNGYTTEKIMDAFAADSVPIYWGSTECVRDFNKKAFINVSDYNSLTELVDKIKQVNDNKDVYLQMLKEPIFEDGRDMIEEYKEKLSQFLKMIVTEGKVYNHSFGRIGLMNFVG